jgi:hypothetical protein
VTDPGLEAAVDAAARARVPIRVAVIATPYDLGSVGALYRKPQRYARFLGQELSYVYKGRLLVVMPNGYGLWRARPVPRRELEAVAALPPAGTTDAAKLADAADRATRTLLDLHDVPVEGAPAVPRPRSTTGDWVKIVAAALGAGALAAALTVRLRRPRSA